MPLSVIFSQDLEIPTVPVSPVNCSLDAPVDLVDPLITLRPNEELSTPDPDCSTARQVQVLFSEWDRFAHDPWRPGILRNIAHRLNLTPAGKQQVGKILRSIIKEQMPFDLPSLWGEEKYLTFQPQLQYRGNGIWVYGGEQSPRMIHSGSAVGALRIAYDLYQNDRLQEIHSAMTVAEEIWKEHPLERLAAAFVLLHITAAGGEIHTDQNRLLCQVAVRGQQRQVRVFGANFAYSIAGRFPHWVNLIGLGLQGQHARLDDWPAAQQANCFFGAPLLDKVGDGLCLALGSERQSFCVGSYRLVSEYDHGQWRLAVSQLRPSRERQLWSASCQLAENRIFFTQGQLTRWTVGGEQTLDFPQGRVSHLLLASLPPLAAYG